ncbi:MAG: hypothetical protein WCK91_01790 [bacterium]
MHKVIKTNYARIIIGVLIALLLFLCWLLVKEYNHVRKIEDINSYKDLVENLRHKVPLSEKDVDIVMPWMTFNYLNSIFKLPAGYLKDNLNISNTRYPNVSISKYVKLAKIDQGVFIDSVKSSIAVYFLKNNLIK